MRALFLDDMDSRHKTFHEQFKSEFETSHVYSLKDLVSEIRNSDKEILFLDHDLGVEFNGVDVANWLSIYYRRRKKPGIVIHSVNPHGRKKMTYVLKKAGFDVTSIPFYELTERFTTLA